MLYSALSDLEIKAQQCLDLIDADLLLVKERNPFLRFYDWNLPRYLTQFGHLASGWAKPAS
jgi:hypothetical protein